MNSQEVITFGQQALYVAVLVSAPLLLATLVVGLVISVLQAATQINEMTLSFIPKLIVVVVVLVGVGPWMITMMTDYMQRVFTSVAFVVA